MAYEQLKLDNQICFRLYTASRLIVQSYAPFFKQMGITYPQYLVLLVLWEKDNRVISEITEALGLETNTMTPLLQRMEKEGLIVRSRGQVDTRQRIISLTKEGKRMEQTARDIPECMVNGLLNDELEMNDLLQLAPLLDKLIKRVKSKEGLKEKQE